MSVQTWRAAHNGEGWNNSVGRNDRSRANETTILDDRSLADDASIANVDKGADDRCLHDTVPATNYM